MILIALQLVRFAIFVINPINVGDGILIATHPARLKFHLGDGFKYNYLNICKDHVLYEPMDTLDAFVYRSRNNYQSYSYRLVPYILTEP